jgi:hypothetical protein
MYPAAQTYWLEPTDRVQLSLRRHTHWDELRPDHPYHSASMPIGEIPATYETHDSEHRTLATVSPEHQAPREDPRWPTSCDCGYVFTNDDEWQHFQDLLYRRIDTGAETPLRDASPGGSWDAWWMPPAFRANSPDGLYLMVILPNGRHWAVDSEASNCTRKGEPHQCWVRHGNPRDCQLTVDKNGDTCAAGAGSIQAGDYHGFLRDGVLTEG